MNLPRILGILTAATPLLTGQPAAGPLDAYRGAHRLIVLSLPEGSSTEKLNKTLTSQRLEIEDRNLIIIDVSEGKQRVATAVRPPLEQASTIRKQLQLSHAEKRPAFVLIGKDGGEKARSHDALNLEPWFALIDAMPMRRAEIQKREATK